MKRLLVILCLLATAGCVSLAGGILIPFASLAEVSKAAEYAVQSLCGEEPVMMIGTEGSSESTYKIWFTASKFVLAEYPPGASMPEALYIGTIDKEGKLSATDRQVFNEEKHRHPCQFLVAESQTRSIIFPWKEGFRQDFRQEARPS